MVRMKTLVDDVAVDPMIMVHRDQTRAPLDPQLTKWWMSWYLLLCVLTFVVDAADAVALVQWLVIYGFLLHLQTLL